MVVSAVLSRAEIYNLGSFSTLLYYCIGPLVQGKYKLTLWELDKGQVRMSMAFAFCAVSLSI